MEYKINVLMYKAWNTNLPENLQYLFQSNSENKYNRSYLDTVTYQYMTDEKKDKWCPLHNSKGANP